MAILCILSTSEQLNMFENAIGGSDKEETSKLQHIPGSKGEA